MNVGDIKKLIAAYLKREPYEFLINDVDLLLIAVNAARRTAELLHDFRYSESSAFLAVGNTGSDISAAYLNSTVSVTGSLVPDVTGTWAASGSYNSTPFFTITVSSVVYFLFFTGSAWNIRPGGFTGSNGWNRISTSSNPIGTYTAIGTSTGTATVTAVNVSMDVKRVRRVSLPIAGGDYLPIEFMTDDEWLARLRRQTGRTAYVAGNTLAQYGVSMVNPVAYQQGKTLLLVPASQFTFPVATKLDVVKFQPDYTLDTDSDFFTENAPEYLYWRSMIEGNKYWMQFISRQEGNVDEPQQFADQAFQSLIEWDQSLSQSTSTPVATQAPDAK